MNNNGEDNNIENTEFAQVTEKAVEFLRTLANYNRLIILSCLLKGEFCVGDLEKN
jgi:hypothetical protein